MQLVFLGPKDQFLIKNKLWVIKMSIFPHKLFWFSLRSPVWKDGSTAVTALVMDDVLYVANLGDSKVHIKLKLVITKGKGVQAR